MKLIFITVIFYIEALFYEAMLWCIMRMSYTSRITAFFSRFAERIGERLYHKAQKIEKCFKGV